jgi:hypothetical protein
MQNNNKSVRLLEFVPKWKVEYSLMFISIHISRFLVGFLLLDLYFYVYFL